VFGCSDGSDGSAGSVLVSGTTVMGPSNDDPTQKVDDTGAGQIELTFLTGDGPG